MLRRSLDECARAWASFSDSDLYYFYAPGQSWGMTGFDKRRMITIMKNFKQLSELMRKLETVDSELKNTVNEVRTVHSQNESGPTRQPSLLLCEQGG